MAGLTRCVRPPRPCRPSKLRLLVDETEPAAAYTLKLLQDRDLWRKLGANAYETVRQRFLFPALILDYLKALQRAKASASALVEPEGVP